MSAGDDQSQLVENDELRHDIQLHLAFSPGTTARSDVTSPEYVNPALDVDESQHESQASRNGTGLHGGTPVDLQSSNGTSAIGTSSMDATKGGSVTSVETTQSRPVFYSSRTGQTTIVQEPVIVTRADGSQVIQTQRCCHLAPHRHPRERPLRMKHIKLMKAFSVLAIVLFFPLGIPAMYYAFKTEKEFNAGIMRGDLDLARKFARRTERLIIFSVLAALLVAVAVFAIVEREMMTEDEYWESRGSNRVMASG